MCRPKYHTIISVLLSHTENMHGSGAVRTVQKHSCECEAYELTESTFSQHHDTMTPLKTQGNED